MLGSFEAQYGNARQVALKKNRWFFEEKHPLEFYLIAALPPDVFNRSMQALEKNRCFFEGKYGYELTSIAKLDNDKFARAMQALEKQGEVFQGKIHLLVSFVELTGDCFEKGLKILGNNTPVEEKVLALNTLYKEFCKDNISYIRRTSKLRGGISTEDALAIVLTQNNIEPWAERTEGVIGNHAVQR